MSNFERAKELLENSDYTCVICSNQEILTSQKRSVTPLLDWLDEGKSLKE